MAEKVPRTISEEQWDALNRRAAKAKPPTTEVLTKAMASQRQKNKASQS
jgi:hypothetical protein